METVKVWSPDFNLQPIVFHNINRLLNLLPIL